MSATRKSSIALLVPFSVFVLIAFARPSSLSAQGTSILGFADVNYLATETDRAEGFDLGQLVGHAAFGLSERVNVFSEVSLTGGSNGYAVEVERLVIRYDFADFFKVSAGRYHTPISYWNTAYHHGLWLQTTVGRPEYTKFGSRFVPVHFVGLLAEGFFPEARVGPGYFAGVGNGRGENIARAGDAGDVNDELAALAGLYVRPASIYGLQAGVAAYRDRIGIEFGPQIDETILAAHVVWEKERPEFLAEYARVLHEPEQGDGVWSDAFYIQLAFRFSGAARAFKPYARLEQIDAPIEDPVFGPLALDYEAGLVGVRYDFSRQAALKAEYRNEQFNNSGRQNSLYLQVSFSFPGTDLTHPYE